MSGALSADGAPLTFLKIGVHRRITARHALATTARIVVVGRVIAGLPFSSPDGARHIRRRRRKLNYWTRSGVNPGTDAWFRRPA